MYRLFVIAVVLFWLGSMGALFMRDVWPAWTAQEPPSMSPGSLESDTPPETQLAIYNEQNKRLGTAWSRVTKTSQETTISSTVSIIAGKMIPSLLIEMNTVFDDEGRLDRFRLEVKGIPQMKIFAEGERRGIYFPCRFQVGVIRRQMNLELAASRMMGQSFQPFAYLPNLEVGQAWRMQMLDPLTAVMSKQARLTPMVIHVIEKEPIEHQGEKVECFVLESTPPRIKAWVDERGYILKQKTQVPMIGTLILKSEKYDAAAREKARTRH
jgi:hypothetical protein